MVDILKSQMLEFLQHKLYIRNMDYEARQELLFKIQEKVEEIMSIIENSKFSDEYITGYSVDNTDEIKMMLETVAKGYINSIDKPNHPTDSIDYWLNL